MSPAASPPAESPAGRAGRHGGSVSPAGSRPRPLQSPPLEAGVRGRQPPLQHHAPPAGREQVRHQDVRHVAVRLQRQLLPELAVPRTRHDGLVTVPSRLDHGAGTLLCSTATAPP